jgi:uncharacterized protein YdeI (YjbR/CyaY-like superfamily)
MPNRIAAVDAYIDKSAAFAQPILEKLRDLFHKAHPEMREVMKWSFPHFEYKGIVGSMAAFKQHCSFGFWKGKLLKDPHRLFPGVSSVGMGGTKITNLKDLPSDKVLLAYIKEAVALNEDGIKAPKAKKKPKKALVVPDYFMAALRKNKHALAIFEAFSPSHQREYVEWVTEAKQEATRAKRLKQAVEWMAEGKSRNWKYQNC